MKLKSVDFCRYKDIKKLPFFNSAYLFGALKFYGFKSSNPLEMLQYVLFFKR